MKTIEATKCWYGHISIIRAECPDCEYPSFIINSMFVCCSLEATEDNEILLNIIDERRESEGEAKRGRLKKIIKDYLIKSQNNRCIYCDKLFGTIYLYGQKPRLVKIHIDHFVSWKYSGDSSENNLVASCDLCNQIKSSLYFETFQEAYVYIRLELQRKRVEIGGEEKKEKKKTNPKIASNYEYPMFVRNVSYSEEIKLKTYRLLNNIK